MSDKIKFYIPDFYNLYGLNIKLLELLWEYPEYFYDNIEIGAIYGTFPGAIWNGGRVMLGTTTLEKIQNTIKIFSALDIPLRFTFSNSLLEEKHIYDTYCNLIMEEANTGNNEVIVNSPILEQYLRENYPNYKYISSTTKCERNIDIINNQCEKYDMVVTDFRDNNNFNFLTKLKYKNKIELLTNSKCSPYCQHRPEHYDFLSKAQLSFSNPQLPSFVNECHANAPTTFFDNLDSPAIITRENLYSKYVDLGFRNFKLEGRLEHKIKVIEYYLYYLVKPEFIEIVRHKILEHCYPYQL